MSINKQLLYYLSITIHINLPYFNMAATDRVEFIEALLHPMYSVLQ